MAEQSRLSRVWDSDVMWSFRHSPVAIIAALVSVTIILAAVLAPWIAPHDPFNPASLNLMDGFSRPMQPNEFTGNTYLMGTDNQGRDIFSTISSNLKFPSIEVSSLGPCGVADGGDQAA